MAKSVLALVGCQPHRSNDHNDNSLTGVLTPETTEDDALAQYYIPQDKFSVEGIIRTKFPGKNFAEYPGASLVQLRAIFEICLLRK